MFAILPSPDHVVAPLLPHVELRTFRPAERDAALEWVSAIEAVEPAR